MIAHLKHFVLVGVSIFGISFVLSTLMGMIVEFPQFESAYSLGRQVGYFFFYFSSAGVIFYVAYVCYRLSQLVLQKSAK